nr:MAG TPA: putative structural protein [Caudoviricetes sp.]
MAVTSNKYIIQNMERLSCFDLTDGTCLFIAEDLQEANMTNEQEDVYATGKNGVKIGSGSRNKASRITATSGSILDGVIATQVGSDIKLETVHVPHMEILTVGAGKTATLTYKAIGAEGNEVPFIYERNSDGTLGKKYAINSAATADQFSFNATTGVITCPTGMTEGTQIVVWYDVEAKNAKHIVNADNVFSRELKVVADVWARGTCDGKDYYGKVIYGRAKASGNFELAFGNDPSVQNMEFEALSNSCSGAGNLLWDFFIFDGEDISKVG